MGSRPVSVDLPRHCETGIGDAYTLDGVYLLELSISVMLHCWGETKQGRGRSETGPVPRMFCRAAGRNDRR